MSMKLEQEVKPDPAKSLSLSNDGIWCSIAGGVDKAYFYLIDTQNQTQYKLESKSLSDTLAPCFINGASDRLMIGGEGKVEIWDVSTRSALRVINGLGSRWEYIVSSFSANNILAIGSNDQKLRLFDVRNWEMFHSKKYEMQPYSLQLTADTKYLVMAGSNGEGCVVFKIIT